MAVQRRIVAACAAIAFLGAGAAWAWLPEPGAMVGFFLRLGAILAALWLAFDDLQRLPGWLLAMLPVAILVLVRWPRALFVLLPFLAVWAIYRRVFTPR